MRMIIYIVFGEDFGGLGHVDRGMCELGAMLTILRGRVNDLE